MNIDEREKLMLLKLFHSIAVCNSLEISLVNSFLL